MAEALLRRTSLQWQSIDIIEDEQLLSRYGHSIPVLKRHDDGRELCWPFDYEQLQRFTQG